MHFRHPFSPDQEVSEADWELYLRETASMIIQEQSPKRYHCYYNVCKIFKSFLI